MKRLIQRLPSPPKTSFFNRRNQPRSVSNIVRVSQVKEKLNELKKASQANEGSATTQIEATTSEMI